jgi:hypothetical protein
MRRVLLPTLLIVPILLATPEIASAKAPTFKLIRSMAPQGLHRHRPTANSLPTLHSNRARRKCAQTYSFGEERESGLTREQNGTASGNAEER